MWVDRQSGSKERGDVPYSKGVLEFARDCPALFEYLTLTAWPDGEERVTSTMVVFLEEGHWKICLSDRAQDRTLWSSGETLEDTMLGLDAAIQSGAAGWRMSGQRSGRGGKK